MARDHRTSWLRNRAEVRLLNAETYWVATVTADARPHSTPVWGVWQDGYFWFVTFVGARKAQNLRTNPNVVVHLDSGEDVVIVDGLAERFEGPGVPAAVSDHYAAKYLDLRTGDPYRPERDLDAGGLLFRVTPTAGRTWLDGGYESMSYRWTY
jgi:hypothetical protein